MARRHTRRCRRVPSLRAESNTRARPCRASSLAVLRTRATQARLGQPAPSAAHRRYRESCPPRRTSHSAAVQMACVFHKWAYRPVVAENADQLRLRTAAFAEKSRPTNTRHRKGQRLRQIDAQPGRLVMTSLLPPATGSALRSSQIDRSSRLSPRPSSSLVRRTQGRGILQLQGQTSCRVGLDVPARRKPGAGPVMKQRICEYRMSQTPRCRRCRCFRHSWTCLPVGSTRHPNGLVDVELCTGRMRTMQ